MLPWNYPARRLSAPLHHRVGLQKARARAAPLAPRASMADLPPDTLFAYTRDHLTSLPFVRGRASWRPSRRFQSSCCRWQLAIKV